MFISREKIRAPEERIHKFENKCDSLDRKFLGRTEVMKIK